MVRLNLILLLVTVLCALGTVAANNRARKLTTEYEREQTRMRELDVEWGQLQLEQSTWANHARIEKIAREKLAMRPPPVERIIALEAAK